MDDDYEVELRKFLALVDPYLKPVYWEIDPQAGLTLAEAVLHYASKADAERQKELALAWGGPPITMDGVEGMIWRHRRSDFNALEYRLKSDLLARLTSGELVATGLDLAEGMLAPRIRVPADRWRILKPDFTNNTAAAHGRQLVDILVFRAEDAPADVARARGASNGPHRYSERALRAWYILRRDTWPTRPTKKPGPSEDDDWADAKAYFGDVPRTAIRKVRRDLAPPEWLRPGPRKGK